MTLEQKIGQLMMVGWQSTSSKEICDLIKKYHYGNVILFSRNIKSAEQLRKLTADIQEAAHKHNGAPALISVDQEGGSIRRIYTGVTSVPGHMAIGAASFSRPKVASEIGTIIGRELKSLGVNCVLAPVADVNTNPMNPIIGIRSFSDDPHLVSLLASQMSKAIQEEGVLSCYKHFIGHGDVHIDSHLDLPCIDASLEELKTKELLPYMGSYLPDAIMTAHILYRKLDDRFPASISKKIIHDLLRKEFGFRGLVISDCLEMDALTRAYSLAGAVIFAVQATCDILTVSHSFGRQLIVRNSLLDAAKTDKAFLRSVEEAVERILAYKEKYCKEMRPEIDWEKNREVAEAASLASITIASGHPFPIDENTVAVGVTNYVSTIAEDKNVEDLDIAAILGAEFNIPHLSIDNKNFNVNEVQEFAKGKKVILALSDSHLTLVQRVLYSNLLQSGARVMLISLRTPYDVLGQPLPECHICIYEYTRQSVKALLKVLRGEKAEGKLPVKLGTRPNQSELKNYLVERIVKYIEQNYAKPLTLESLAEEFYLSPGYLCRLFKQKVGINFLDYLNMVRISRAKHLLLTTNLRVYEVGNLCGFADMNYFTKAFKKATGVTPTYFRNHSGYYD